MSLDTDFTQAAENVKNLKSKPTDDELLDLYGLYKQGTVGPVDIPRPGVFDLKGKAKWDAWNSRKEMTKEEAQEKYIEYVKNLVAKYGL